MRMFGKRPLQSEKTILENTARGVILELRFEGEDDTSRGHKMAAFITSAIKEHRPAAIVLNLLGCRTIFDNDVGCMAAAFRDRERQSNLPCSIAVKGGAGRSLRTLLAMSKMTEVFDIVIVDNVDEALEQARRAVTGDTA